MKSNQTKSTGASMFATRILEAVQKGDPSAVDQLLPLVHEDLRRLAAHKMANEAAGQTLQPTALVHESWLRLVGSHVADSTGCAICKSRGEETRFSPTRYGAGQDVRYLLNPLIGQI